MPGNDRSEVDHRTNRARGDVSHRGPERVIGWRLRARVANSHGASTGIVAAVQTLAASFTLSRSTFEVSICATPCHIWSSTTSSAELSPFNHTPTITGIQTLTPAIRMITLALTGSYVLIHRDIG